MVMEHPVTLLETSASKVRWVHLVDYAIFYGLVRVEVAWPGDVTLKLVCWVSCTPGHDANLHAFGRPERHCV